MINVLFFAQVRELLGESAIQVEATAEINSAETLRAVLASKDEKWGKVLASDKLLVAVNQTISGWDTQVQDGDEVAFFPPVTGG
ncbi:MULTISPECIES: molybdopterin synthase sulfur carrier subunit [Shewanella]|uniref:Molybdopterin synthase sulfur carrier subunit n=2 Tax=Shewanella TaxID=22 RepID=B1KP08_SHEWM|nr:MULTISPECIES: molybdopterin synthase sulfur carrier subunit [Shewanella]ACA89039.1 molybdopterin converting factor, subunit 1 [Shewanella woodyi ATCC 51908]MBW8185049.1 molybdopterin synthase sulfur carrier subunit [Shewanella nanhaiensis]